MFLLLFTFSVSRFDDYSSISAVPQQPLVKHQYKFHFGCEKRSVCYRICVSYCICFCISEEMIFHCSNSECYTLWSDAFLHCVRSLLRCIHVSLSSLTSSGTDLFERSETCERQGRSVKVIFFSLQTPTQKKCIFWRGWRYSTSVSFYLYWLIKLSV